MHDYINYRKSKMRLQAHVIISGYSYEVELTEQQPFHN